MGIELLIGLAAIAFVVYAYVNGGIIVTTPVGDLYFLAAGWYGDIMLGGRIIGVTVADWFSVSIWIVGYPQEDNDATLR